MNIERCFNVVAITERFVAKGFKSPLSQLSMTDNTIMKMFCGLSTKITLLCHQTEYM